MTKKPLTLTFAALVLLAAAGAVYVQAGAQEPAVQQPLIMEALVNMEQAALTINGYDFPASVPDVTLGMNELAVVSASDSAVLTGLPELLPGTYLLSAAWPEGVGAIFFLTVGAAGPQGPQGPQGPMGGSGVFLSSAPESSSVGTAAAGDSASVAGKLMRAATRRRTTPDNNNTHLGGRTLEAVTTGRGNTAVGSRYAARGDDRRTERRLRLADPAQPDDRARQPGHRHRFDGARDGRVVQHGDRQRHAEGHRVR